MPLQKAFYLSIVLLLGLIIFPRDISAACSSCTVQRLGHDAKMSWEYEDDPSWFFEYFYEQKNWDKMPARQAHGLHHAGHHFHDKTTEDLHHFKIGNHVSDEWTVFVELPYVIRRSLEVDDHAILGSNQVSEGLGDAHLVGEYRFFRTDNKSAGAVAGIKFPTGSTDEENSGGTRFEAELQPGTGSFDYIAGIIYRQTSGRFDFTGNAAYVFNMLGSQGVEMGDIVSTSIAADYILNPGNENFRTRVGIDTVFQFEQKQVDHGKDVTDSGGATLLAGPSLKMDVTKRFSLFAAFLLPAFQDLGGVHQELEYQWTGGGKFIW